MATSYAKWSLAELEKERERIDKAIEKKSGQERNKVRAKLASIARKSGFALAELIEEDAPRSSATGKKRAVKKRSAAKGKKVPPKYAHPTDKSMTWTGRGRTPLWMVELEKSGKARDQFLIK